MIHTERERERHTHTDTEKGIRERGEGERSLAREGTRPLRSIYSGLGSLVVRFKKNKFNFNH